MIFANFNQSNNYNQNQNNQNYQNEKSFEDKEIKENDLQLNFVQFRNQIEMATAKTNYFNKLNQHQINFNGLSKSLISNSNSDSNLISDSNSNSNTKSHAKDFMINMGSSMEKSKSDCINEVTISETGGIDKDDKSGSDLNVQRELFEKEMNFSCSNTGRKAKNLVKKEMENSNEDEIFSFLNGNQEGMQDCFSYLSL